MLKFASQLTLRCEDRYIQKGRNHHVTALIGLKSIQMSIIFLTVQFSKFEINEIVYILKAVFLFLMQNL